MELFYDSARIIFNFLLFLFVEVPYKTVMRAIGVTLFAVYAIGLLPLCILAEILFGDYETFLHGLADKVNDLSEILVDMGDLTTDRIFDWRGNSTAEISVSSKRHP